MTSGAISPHSLLMNIDMTFIAISGSLYKFKGGMAILAGNRLVLPYQWEFRNTMIKG
ncbi:MAG: hypothetical protein IPH84_07935 [Bacteroidales bacterium]|nr:hypothetical protein [Bacteroidales bacterium]